MQAATPLWQILVVVIGRGCKLLPPLGFLTFVNTQGCKILPLLGSLGLSLAVPGFTRKPLSLKTVLALSKVVFVRLYILQQCSVATIVAQQRSNATMVLSSVQCY